jgi:pyridoxamine 5'-phosphate oxidase family protein
MSVFTPAEIAYLASQRLGRIATVDSGGQPHAVPVGFQYNPETDTIDIGGHGFAKSKKFRDVQANPRVAFVVDDLASVSPWRPRGIEVRGVAEVLGSGGETFGRGYDPQIFRVRARRIVSWGLAAERRSAMVRS